MTDTERQTDQPDAPLSPASADLDYDVVQHLADMRQPIGGIRQMSVDLTSLEGIDYISECDRDRIAVRAQGFQQPCERCDGRVVLLAGLDVVVGF